jgi:predicted transport protein
MALSGAEMLVRVSASLPDKTGKSLEQWIAEVGKAGIDPLDQSAVRQWLKSAHGLTKPQQEAIAIAAAKEAGWHEPTADDHLAAQYAGPKQGLKAIYDAVLAEAAKLGDDVVVEVRAGFVAVNRKRQFAALQPATASRIDLGLRFVAPPSDERLKPAKAPGQSTHKVGLTAVEQVDDGIGALLRQAYEQN